MFGHRRLVAKVLACFIGLFNAMVAGAAAQGMWQQSASTSLEGWGVPKYGCRRCCHGCKL